MTTRSNMSSRSSVKLKSQKSAALACAAVSAGIITLASWTSRRQHYDFSSTGVHRRLSLLDEDQDLPGIFPFRPQDYLGFGCATLGLLLAAGGGIGGGGMLVPIYILLLEFPVKRAIPLSSVTVLGGAVANNLLNIRKVHPDHPERPAIDWDLVLQFGPTAIAGALVGDDLNKLLPGIVLLVLMLLLLSVTAQETLSKAWKLYQKEEQEEKNKIENVNESANGSGNGHNGAATESTPLVKRKHLETDVEASNGNGSSHNLDGESEAIRRQCINNAIKLLSLFAVVTVLDLLQGTPDDGGGGPLRLRRCGTTCYWASEALKFLSIVLFSLHVRSSILRRQEAGGPVLSEIRWDERNTIVYPSLGITAGLVAGMFGIGGGIVMAPLMLALGVHPKVVSATSACMILFTSGMSTLCYLVFGYLKYDYAIFCLVLGFLSTLVGQTAMSALLTWSGQRSLYIAFCIGGVVAISAVAMGIESVVAIFYS